MDWKVFVLHQGKLLVNHVLAPDAATAIQEVVNVGYHQSAVMGVVNVQLDEVCHGGQTVVPESSD